MLVILGALVGAAALAAYTYLRRERLGPAGLGFAALRWSGIAGLVLLVSDPPWPGPGAAAPPLVLLDRSLSMGVRGGHWDQARDTAAALAGAAGRVVGFGSSVGPVVDSLPLDGATRLRDALATARAVGGPIRVVTDGEVADAAALPRSSLDGVRFVVLPRDSVPGAAVTGFRAAPAVHAGDSIPIAVTLATWGGIAADSARIEIDVDGRRTVVRTVALPPPPATLQRSLQVPSAGLRAGDHVIDLRIAVTGDAEPGDNARVRVVSVTAAPPLVVVIDPASWEGRFLFETFQAVAGVPTRGFARIGNGRWIDLATSRAVPSEEVRAAAVASALLVVHGSGNAVGLASRRGPVWEWTVTDTGEQTLAGDWYVLDELPASRLLAALARVEWDSVPPLTSLQSSPADTGQAVLVARLGRRGQPRSVVVSAVDGGRRVLRTLGTGFYRWSLRGGASREALRALVAAGTDWLLASAGLDARAPLEVDREVTRDTPVSFRWGGVPVPDSLPVTVESDGVERRFVLRFDATGRADLALPVGVHRWSVPEPPVSGIVAVEAYSDELPPAPVTVPRVESAGRRPPGAPSHVRDRWWMYVVVLIALIGEWAWRQRRGLP